MLENLGLGGFHLISLLVIQYLVVWKRLLISRRPLGWFVTFAIYLSYTKILWLNRRIYFSIRRNALQLVADAKIVLLTILHPLHQLGLSPLSSILRWSPVIASAWIALLVWITGLLIPPFVNDVVHLEHIVVKVIAMSLAIHLDLDSAWLLLIRLILSANISVNNLIVLCVGLTSHIRSPLGANRHLLTYLINRVTHRLERASNK